MSTREPSKVKEAPTDCDCTKATSPESDTRLASRLEPHNVLLLLIAFRLVNALTTQTFFQPDEYFQALEPAWQWAFGEEAGGWITWEWKHHLRSAIHPTVFGICYKLADSLAELLKLDGHSRTELLLNAPKILQGVFAALGDFYTWKLASYIYGPQSSASLSTLLLTVVSPWQWFVSTRTFSNSLETTLTVIALYNWPWHWAVPLSSSEVTAAILDQDGVRIRDKMRPKENSMDEVTRLRRSLLCAAVAVILRPTNILIWVMLGSYTLIRNWSGPSQEKKIIVRESAVCGTTILLLSAVIDRIFYDAWVFPPVNFLRVNVVQSLASFYGNNDWHYYISQGYPLLLITALPYALLGLYQVLSGMVDGVTPRGQTTLWLLSLICVTVPAAFSVISHKEVRFIYPLLPALHIISGLPLATYLHPLLHPQSSQSQSSLTKRPILLLVIITNISISYYTTQVHNSGLIQLTSYLRNEFESHYLPLSPSVSQNMTFGILAPCHSTPWRSHIQYPPTLTHAGIQGWALTCEPPLNLTASEKANYLDEADQFYDNPNLWVKKFMSRHVPLSATSSSSTFPPPGIHAPHHQHGKITTIDPSILDKERAQHYWLTRQGRKPWPDYLIFFAHLEPTVQNILRGSGYAECKRLFNSHWHDDWRRKGDVVVWCIDPERQREWGKDTEPDQMCMDKGGCRFGDGEVPAGEVSEDKGRRTGMGQGLSGRVQEVATSKTQDDAEPFRRVVEKPFWKVRDPEPKPIDDT